MKITRDKSDNNRFEVESESRNGKFHIVTLDKRLCDCPHFLYRMRAAGGVCKHIAAVENFVANDETGKTNYKGKKNLSCDSVLEFVRKKGEVDSIELIDKYGEEAVDLLIKRGDLMEKNGVIMVVE